MRYYLDTKFNESGHDRPIELISLALVREDGEYLCAELIDGWRPENSSEWVRANVIPHLQRMPRLWRSELRERIEGLTKNDKRPEFWAYYADYDWVVFCQLWGAMLKLPFKFPKFCRDIIQEATRLGLQGELKFQVNRTGPEHCALADARHAKAMHEWLLSQKGIR